MPIVLPPVALSLLLKLAHGLGLRGPWSAALPADTVTSVVEGPAEGSAESVPEERWFGACGWFDSSHELTQGLQVQELDTPDVLAAALPLGVWLERQLAT